MAITTYILIETAADKTKDVVTALRNTKLFKAVDAITGPFDIIAIAECPDLNTVGD
ncbi:MAG: Lrp/AsnC family transcriptional regulator [Chloroflexi bacterium]|nr:Lrp/AsnC family transcriptional regulator [Chloroflexota bacterium]